MHDVNTYQNGEEVLRSQVMVDLIPIIKKNTICIINFC